MPRQVTSPAGGGRRLGKEPGRRAERKPQYDDGRGSRGYPGGGGAQVRPGANPMAMGVQPGRRGLRRRGLVLPGEGDQPRAVRAAQSRAGPEREVSRGPLGMQVRLSEPRARGYPGPGLDRWIPLLRRWRP